MIGGAERVLQALCEDLPQHDVEPSVGCFRAAGPVGRALGDAGVPVSEQLAPARRSLAQVWALRADLRRHRTHLVYCLDHSNVLWYGRLAARLAGCPSVAAIHRTRRADGSPSLGRADRLLMGWTKRVIAVSREHGRYLSEDEGLDGRRVTVIHNGVDPGRFPPRRTGEELAAHRRSLGWPEEEPVVGIVAALRPEKNHRLLLEAAVRIPRERRPHVAIIGAGPTEGRLHDVVGELGLRSTVHWLGARDDVPDLLASLDLLALCSDPNVETFPMCVLEAMAARLPVVCTDVGSLREMVQDGRTGRLVPPGNPAALADAIDAILQTPDRGAGLGSAGAARVASEFTRAAMVSRTASLLWEVSGRIRGGTA